MKYLILFLITVCLRNTILFSQSAKDSSWKKSCVFTAFNEGRVLMKNGNLIAAKMNYNAENQSIVYLDKETIMELLNLREVDTVYLNGFRFITVANKVYGVLPLEKFYFTFSNRIKPVVATYDHNGSSMQVQNQTSNTVTDVFISRNFKGNFQYENQVFLWFKKNEKAVLIKNNKDASEIFPEKNKESIMNFLNRKSIHIENMSLSDLGLFSEYILTLNK